MDADRAEASVSGRLLGDSRGEPSASGGIRGVGHNDVFASRKSLEARHAGPFASRSRRLMSRSQPFVCRSSPVMSRSRTFRRVSSTSASGSPMLTSRSRRGRCDSRRGICRSRLGICDSRHRPVRSVVSRRGPRRFRCVSRDATGGASPEGRSSSTLRRVSGLHRTGCRAFRRSRNPDGRACGTGPECAHGSGSRS